MTLMLVWSFQRITYEENSNLTRWFIGVAQVVANQYAELGTRGSKPKPEDKSTND